MIAAREEAKRLREEQLEETLDEDGVQRKPHAQISVISNAISKTISPNCCMVIEFIYPFHLSSGFNKLFP